MRVCDQTRNHDIVHMQWSSNSTNMVGSLPSLTSPANKQFFSKVLNSCRAFHSTSILNKNAYRSNQVLNKNAYKNSHHGFKPTIEEYLKVQLPFSLVQLPYKN